MFYGEKHRRLQDNITKIKQLPGVLTVDEHEFIRSRYKWTKLRATVHSPSFQPSNTEVLLDDNALSSGGLPVNFVSNDERPVKVAQLFVENWWEACIDTDSPQTEIDNTMQEIVREQRDKHPEDWIEPINRVQDHPDTDFGQTQYFAHAPRFLPSKTQEE